MKSAIPFIIKPKDIMLLNENMSLRTAQREHKYIRDALGIKHKRLTVQQYCDYWGDKYETVVEVLIKKRAEME